MKAKVSSAAGTVSTNAKVLGAAAYQKTSGVREVVGQKYTVSLHLSNFSKNFKENPKVQETSAKASASASAAKQKVSEGVFSLYNKYWKKEG